MIEDTKEFIEFLAEHDISERQFMLCWILYLDKEKYKGQLLPEEGESIANIYRYIELVDQWSSKEIKELVERDYLIDRSSGKNYYPDQLEVADKFVDAVFATQTQFELFVNEYPSFTEHFDDPRKGDIPLKAVDMERVHKIFNRKIRSKVKFKKLMKSLKWAKEQDMVRMNILKYLSGELWKAHLKKMKEGTSQTKQTSIN